MDALPFISCSILTNMVAYQIWIGEIIWFSTHHILYSLKLLAVLSLALRQMVLLALGPHISDFTCVFSFERFYYRHFPICCAEVGRMSKISRCIISTRYRPYYFSAIRIPEIMFWIQNPLKVIPNSTLLVVIISSWPLIWGKKCVTSIPGSDNSCQVIKVGVAEPYTVFEH